MYVATQGVYARTGTFTPPSYWPSAPAYQDAYLAVKSPAYTVDTLDTTHHCYHLLPINPKYGRLPCVQFYTYLGAKVRTQDDDEPQRVGLLPSPKSKRPLHRQRHRKYFLWLPLFGNSGVFVGLLAASGLSELHPRESSR